MPLIRLWQPRTEVAVAFVVGRDLQVETALQADVMNAIEYALPSAEALDSCVANWNIKFVDTVADNATCLRAEAAARPSAAAGEPLQAGWIVMAGGATPAEWNLPGRYVAIEMERLGVAGFHVED